MAKDIVDETREKTVLPITVVIPTFHEEIALPKLLESLKKQFFSPSEIVVADAFSTDKTREIANSFGCTVVDGGKIACGRNAGAKVAKSEYLLFLDADTELPTPLVLGEAFFQFLKRDIDIASARFVVPKDMKPGFGKNAGVVMWGFTNAVKAIQSAASHPHWEGGAFILVKRSVFEHVGGFDEKLSIGEDRTFFVKASKLGYKYASLPIDIVTSVRRYDSPRKLAKLVAFVAIEAVAISAGIYAGSKAMQGLWKWYGRLGGGPGKDPNEVS